MSTVVACGISIIVGVLICHLVNAKFTTEENIGRFIGVMIALILIAFFFSDKGQIVLRRIVEIFPINLL